MQHLVIRRMQDALGSAERPEIGLFTQTHTTQHPLPWGQVAVRDRVWLKWSGGPVVATTTVQGFLQMERCTPLRLRALTVGTRLHGAESYWQSLPPLFNAVLVFLKDEQWLKEVFVPQARSRGVSWFVLNRPELQRAWLSDSEGSRSRVAQPTRTADRRGSRSPSQGLRFEVLRRDGFRCVYCGRSAAEVPLTADHGVAWSQGGATVLDNLRAACADCNLGKGARPLT